MQTIFADTILNITVNGHLVRLDLGTVRPVQTANGKQEMRASASQQLVMPIEGFVRAFGMQEQVVKKLIDDGVLKAKSSSEPSATISAGTTTES